MDIGLTRLQNHGILKPEFKTAAEVVAWFGAVQAQDFAAAKRALALRMGKADDNTIEEAFNKGEILRTHVLRPTWHFVTPADIRWLLALTGPRVQLYNGSYYRKSGFDRNIFKKTNELITKALAGGKALQRSDLEKALEQGGILTEKIGLSFIMMQAELEGLICSGPRVGKQFTYMLLEERVSEIKGISRDEALAELVRRYFTSHGPAQLQDFSWWSGLTVADAKKGLEINKSALKKENINGKTYWSAGSVKPDISRKCYLLPAFDEFTVAYKDRLEIIEEKYYRYMNAGGGMLKPVIVINGRIKGTWTRIVKKNKVIISLSPFEELPEQEKKAVMHSAQDYGNFLNLPAETEFLTK